MSRAKGDPGQVLGACPANAPIRKRCRRAPSGRARHHDPWGVRDRGVGRAVSIGRNLAHLGLAERSQGRSVNDRGPAWRDRERLLKRAEEAFGCHAGGDLELVVA